MCVALSIFILQYYIFHELLNYTVWFLFYFMVLKLECSHQIQNYDNTYKRQSKVGLSSHTGPVLVSSVFTFLCIEDPHKLMIITWLNIIINIILNQFFLSFTISSIPIFPFKFDCCHRACCFSTQEDKICE